MSKQNGYDFKKDMEKEQGFFISIKKGIKKKILKIKIITLMKEIMMLS